MGMNSARNHKLVFGLMLTMIGIRFALFALAALGLITTVLPFGASVLSWIVPVVMPLIVISVMLVTGRRGMMMKHQQQVTPASDKEPLLEILQKRLASGQITKAQYEKIKKVLLDEENHSSSQVLD